MPGRILFFTQVFPPDPAAVGQQMADAARELVRRGHAVTVYTADRGYDDPELRYARREFMHGVAVRRLRWSSLGKSSIVRRIVGAVSFMGQTFALILTTRRPAGIVFSTVPPMIGVVVSAAAALRRIPTLYWVMDLNPDQLIALGRIAPRSMAARLLDAAGRWMLRRADATVALDRFMARRLSAKTRLPSEPRIVPPWAHEDEMDSRGATPDDFRTRHGLGESFVVMYSGNHTTSNPLTTVLEAAVRLRHDERIRFVFVGGGLGKREVEQYRDELGLPNVLSLPYQPIEDLGGALRAANLHVVALGDPMVGIIHPCKIYGVMAAGRPVLYLGPDTSHIMDMLGEHEFGWHVDHGHVEKAVDLIRSLAEDTGGAVQQRGRRASAALPAYSQTLQCGRFCDIVEITFGLRFGAASVASAAAQPARL